MQSLFRLIALLACALPATLQAQTCYEWVMGTIPGGGSPFHGATGSDIATQTLAAVASSCASSGATCSVGTVTKPGAALVGETGSVTINYVFNPPYTGSGAWGTWDYTATPLAECPPPEDCDTSKTGQMRNAVVDGLSGDDCIGMWCHPSGDRCDASSHCKMTLDHSYSFGSTALATYQIGGDSCEVGEPTFDVGAGGEGEKCTDGGTSLTACQADTGAKNCGYLNGAYACLKADAPKDRCYEIGTALICAEGVPTPPVPDSGTAGVPATPDETISVTNGSLTTNFNYFNSTTIAGSNRPPSDGQPAGGAGNGSGRTGEGEGDDSDESVGGGISCDAPPTCEGDVIDCAILRQEWEMRCVTLPTGDALLEAVGLPTGDEEGASLSEQEVDIGEEFDQGGWLETTACPSDIPIDLGDWGSYDIEVSQFCGYLEVLGFLFLACSMIGGARIVVGGF